MGKAIIPVDLDLLKGMFMLPESYKITGVVPFQETPDLIYFYVESDELPESTGKRPLPQIQLHCSVDFHPDHHDFRRITVIPRIQKAIEDAKE